MKTLADFKRKLIVGAKMSTKYHQDYTTGLKMVHDPIPIRSLSIVQTKSFALSTLKNDGTYSDSWMDIPKSSMCNIKDESITIYTRDYSNRFNELGDQLKDEELPLIPFITYTFV